MYPGENMDIYEKFKQKPEIYNDLSLEDKYNIKDLLLKDNSLTSKEKQVLRKQHNQKKETYYYDT